MGQATCGWVLPSDVVENLSLAAHLQLSAFSGESGALKSYQRMVPKADLQERSQGLAG